MLSDSCLAILKRHVEIKGRNAVIAELGVSSATLSQVLGGKYGASTDNIEAKIMKIYGNDGKVDCPVMGRIEPSDCVANHERAMRRSFAGNPKTIRLHVACRKCDFRR